MTCFLEMQSLGEFAMGHIERISIKESPCRLNDSIFVIKLGCAREKVILLGSRPRTGLAKGSITEAVGFIGAPRKLQLW
ncbi:MAG: hypothetical protein ACREFF_00660 [Candidatus Udaeobacter sp.]